MIGLPPVFLFLIGTTAVRALPSPASDRVPKITTANVTADFDPIYNGNNGYVQEGYPPGPYCSLNWTTVPGFYDIFEIQGNPSSPVIPQSGGYESNFGFGYTSPQGPQRLGAAYPGSHVIAFQLFDFYFGCTVPTNVPASEYQNSKYKLGEPCGITVKGYRGDYPALGPAVATANFQFVPQIQTGTLGSNYSVMTHAVLPASFKNLRTVTLNGTTTSPRAISGPTVYLDTFTYAVTNATL